MIKVKPRHLLLAAVTALLSITLAGCAADPLAAQYLAGSGKNYIAGDGSITEIAEENRGDPVHFQAETENGEAVSSDEMIGKILVLNFWYAGCAPCRAEAPELQAAWEKFQSEPVTFLGVNVRDQSGTALSFAQTYGITYDSVIDANDGKMQLAFSGTVAANAVPTTLIIDKQGRVASRILGRIPDQSVLDALISTALDEQGPPAPDPVSSNG
ncbi:TlpA family protein disulfide reductase [Herbiconiux sp. YIM B11900]|uniref:TlpA family protein disulfide reductase n=1 Tax=Herbiconiux sp. YIM B11900 TaxID=3404131 RepID=UPI003F860DD1